MKEMTCTGAAGEWWPIHDEDQLEDDVERTLIDWASDDCKESSGYGVSDDHCEVHPTGEGGCEDCFRAMVDRVDAEVKAWAKGEVGTVVSELLDTGLAARWLASKRMTFRLRESRDL
jgi:hypothetical protein